MDELPAALVVRVIARVSTNPNSNVPAHTSSRFSVPSWLTKGPVLNPPTETPRIPAATNSGKSRFAWRVSKEIPAMPQSISRVNVSNRNTITHSTR